MGATGTLKEGYDLKGGSELLERDPQKKKKNSLVEVAAHML